MKWLIFVLCLGSVSSKGLDVIDDMPKWLRESEKENEDRGVASLVGRSYNLCAGVKNKGRFNLRIIIDKLLVLSELAGYSVSRDAVQERTQLIVDDIHRLANRTKYPIQFDFECFKRSICSVDEVYGLSTLALKTRQLINNIKIWGKAFQRPKIEDSEYLGLENEAAFLDAMAREFRRQMFRRQLLVRQL
ncbi:unnamed protein product [Bursaphelenchus xylophilus]|uniref:(pine wood nematode) hypothetical protein n=1 Tax=Bursaphelenchus xylophilus TaxID=6326 RepID=A0A1I7RZ49_BURXY|nr:unnamed protein product [Bursaphelenchus xylophilus]CAG9106855.1 unnamed protein product [Bursaphelenchus xylophilus]